MSKQLDDIRSRIEALGIDFQFLSEIKTSMNGIERETWLLEYEGSQFVFVAGQKNVTLGWDIKKCPLGEGVLEGLREEFDLGHEYYENQQEEMKDDYKNRIKEAEADGDLDKAEELRLELSEELEAYEEDMNEGGYGDWENYMKKWNEKLSEYLSPLRTADIGDMIVEVDNRYIEEDAPSLAEAVRSLKEGFFTLATEDEWEYLCNGGTRTLFRWGDTLSDVMEEIFNVGSVSNAKEKPLLEQPNMFGLFIAYNSYKYEIIDNTKYVKGGDGGSSLCGGDGGIHVLPCYTAFYREQVDEHNQRLSNNYYCYRRIIRLP
ncbi:MAG: hypothetical protein K2N63_06505 [Lachnospiraceae bacterium]|nr:hypothetical protein [Lachnospiraceae bacterium]